MSLAVHWPERGELPEGNPCFKLTVADRPAQWVIISWAITSAQECSRYKDPVGRPSQLPVLLLREKRYRYRKVHVASSEIQSVFKKKKKVILHQEKKKKLIQMSSSRFDPVSVSLRKQKYLIFALLFFHFWGRMWSFLKIKEVGLQLCLAASLYSRLNVCRVGAAGSNAAHFAALPTHLLPASSSVSVFLFFFYYYFQDYLSRIKLYAPPPPSSLPPFSRLHHSVKTWWEAISIMKMD